MRFTLLHTPVKISFLFFSLLGFLFFTSSNPVLIVGIFSVLLHELGHILVMIFLGDEISLFEIKPFGVAIVKKNAFAMSFKKEVLIYLAGPLLNGTVAVFGYLLYTSSGNYLLGICAAVNLLLFLFNLLPVSVLDGGQLLKLLCVETLGLQKGEGLFFKVSCCVCVLLLLLSIFLVAEKRVNVTIAITALYLFVANFKKR